MDIKHAVVGNRVKIPPGSEFYSTHTGSRNPPCKGTISNIDKDSLDVDDFGIDVQWDNGETNNYRLMDLIFVESPSSEPRIWYYVGTTPCENCFSTLEEANEKLDELSKPFINWDNCGEVKYKQVQYFGKALFIKQSHQYVFTSYNGSVQSSIKKPTWEPENKKWSLDASLSNDVLCTGVCVNYPEKTLKYFE